MKRINDIEILPLPLGLSAREYYRMMIDRYNSLAWLRGVMHGRETEGLNTNPPGRYEIMLRHMELRFQKELLELTRLHFYAIAEHRPGREVAA